MIEKVKFTYDKVLGNNLVLVMLHHKDIRWNKISDTLDQMEFD